jgi:hypothetical protein
MNDLLIDSAFNKWVWLLHAAEIEFPHTHSNLRDEKTEIKMCVIYYCFCEI